MFLLHMPVNKFFSLFFDSVNYLSLVMLQDMEYMLGKGQRYGWFILNLTFTNCEVTTEQQKIC